MSLPVVTPVQAGGFIDLSLEFFAFAILSAVIGLRGGGDISMRITTVFVLLFPVLVVITLLLSRGLRSIRPI